MSPQPAHPLFAPLALSALFSCSTVPESTELSNVPIATATASPVAHDTKLLPSDAVSNLYFGQSTRGIGDIDGDGFGDSAVGTREHSVDGSLDDAGAVYLFHGSPRGVSARSETLLTAFDAAEDAEFGYRIVGDGDINADGFDDLVVGAPEEGAEGAVYVYYGAATGLDADAPDKLVPARPTPYASYFAWSLDFAGDTDGDGYDDLVVGQTGTTFETVRYGGAFVYQGSADGLLPADDLPVVSSLVTDRTTFASAISRAGDVDADGYADVILSALADDEAGANSGAAFVWFGSSSGVGPSDEQKLMASDARRYESFGNGLGGGGDIDADGFDDVVIGAPKASHSGSNSGVAYAFFGSADGIDTTSESLLQTDAAGVGDYTAELVHIVGDLDDDGFDDVAISAAGIGTAGTLLLWFGSADRFDGASPMALTSSDGSAGDTFGDSHGPAGDLDGDGIDDLVVGAYGDDDAASGAGAAYVYMGSSSGDWD